MINEQFIRESRKRLENLNIPLIYESFPVDFKVDINGWSFPDDKEKGTIDVELTPEEITELKNKGLLKKAELISGNIYRIRRLRTLDIEIGADETIDQMNALKNRYDEGEFTGLSGIADLKSKFAKLYKDTCTQRCPHCFNQEDDFYVSKIINGQTLMKWSEIKELIRVAKRFGLESVKFLGIGEIFKNSRLFEILDALRTEKIKIAIFTKGPALGDDQTAKSCGYEGIYTAEDLVKRISEYQNVSILLGANSFNPIFQDAMVGCGKDGGVINYTQKRDKALQLLVKYEFNNPKKGKRLALIAAPVTPQVSDETIEMYEWAMKRNITVVTIPTMVSGKGADELEWLLGQFESNEILIGKYDPMRKMTREQRYTEWVVDFYTDIYLKALDMGLTDLETLKTEGISGYAGVAKCQQKHNGMYIRLPGTVQECPGRCVGAEILEDIRVQNLVTTWLDSINYDRKDCRSLCAVKMKDLTGNRIKVCDCCQIYENVGSMPPELEMRVIENLDSLFNKEVESVM
jgi:MoaA/NifB/PqqE/SkfB family radical SAM enzyme